MTPEQVQDLIERLEKADAELLAGLKGRISEVGFEAMRLQGKAQGVRLALSYVREYAPTPPPRRTPDER